MASYDIRELWKEYESVAMHFNDLLMRLRTQSLGGLAIVGTLGSFLVRENVEAPERYAFLALLMAALLIAWMALAVLDLRYYDRMLIGAVVAIHELERKSATSEVVDRIDLSLRIAEAVDLDHPTVRYRWLDGRRFYYWAVGLMLAAFVVIFTALAVVRG
ncbi:MAG: hypothetical protein R3E77_00815 [Steroidobacteraceae bacterium]